MTATDYALAIGVGTLAGLVARSIGATEAAGQILGAAAAVVALAVLWFT